MKKNSKKLTIQQKKDQEFYKKRIDNWKNTRNRMGTEFTKFGNTKFYGSAIIPDGTLEELYKSAWLIKRICSVIPEDSLKNWITINYKDKNILNNIKEDIKRLSIRSKLLQAALWARLYGGAGLFLGIDDGGENLSQPLNFNNIKTIDFINVIDKRELIVYKVYDNIMADNYLEPEIYQIMPATGIGASQFIHASRVIRIDGNKLPNNSYISNNYYHSSIVQDLYDDFKNYGVALGAGAETLPDFVTKVYKMQGLKALIESDNKEIVDNMIEYVSNKQSIDGITVIDEDSEFNKIQTPITGLSELINIYIEMTAASTHIPRMILFGQQLGTLAASTETMRTYIGNLEKYQQQNLQNPISKILQVLFKVYDKSENNKIDWNFEPIYTSTNKEQSEIIDTTSKADERYINLGVLTPMEVRKSRFGNEKFSMSYKIDNEELPEMIEEKTDELKYKHVHKSSNDYITSEEINLVAGSHMHIITTQTGIVIETGKAIETEKGHYHVELNSKGEESNNITSLEINIAFDNWKKRDY